MKTGLSVVIVLAAGVFAAPLHPTAHAQQDFKKDRSSAREAPKGTGGSKAFRERGQTFEKSPRFKPEVHREPRVKRSPITERRPPSELQREPRLKKPPIVKHRPPPTVRHARRPWRPGFRYRWIVVPSILIAEELNWCHYHRFRVSEMRFHRDVECHQHSRWNHPSIRYVEEY